ncbi:phosphoribosyl-dephospho-CoA transferase MdcG domain-containing protein, partial [Acinetobacter baumannii]
TPRVYGSLLWQSLSGKPCLRDDSDLDLLFDLEDPAPLPALLALLRHADGALRLDGEIRCGAHAVAWRELAAALDGRSPRRVLAKSDDGIVLI